MDRTARRTFELGARYYNPAAGQRGSNHRGHPATAEVEYTDDEREFMVALDRWKRENRRPHPTCSEVLAVLVALGYRKVAEGRPLPTAKDAKPPLTLTHDGLTLTIHEWAKRLGLNYATIYNRHQAGASDEEALRLPPRAAA